MKKLPLKKVLPKKKPLTDREKMLKRFGITEQITSQLGFNPKTQEWFGWSHRAIAGFKVGSSVKKGDVLAHYYKVGFKAKTLADAKQMAKKFAEDVS